MAPGIPAERGRSQSCLRLYLARPWRNATQGSPGTWSPNHHGPNHRGPRPPRPRPHHLALHCRRRGRAHHGSQSGAGRSAVRPGTATAAGDLTRRRKRELSGRQQRDRRHQLTESGELRIQVFPNSFSEDATGEYNAGYSLQHTRDGVHSSTRRPGDSSAPACGGRGHRRALGLRGDRGEPWLYRRKHRRPCSGARPAARPHRRYSAGQSAQRVQ